MSAPAHGLSPHARGLVEAAIGRLGSQKRVAQRIGYAPASLSIAMTGHYRGSLATMEAAIVAQLGSAIDCPHLGRAIDPAECLAHRTRPIPTANPADLRHWRACRYCPRNPDARDLSTPPTPTEDPTEERTVA